MDNKLPDILVDRAAFRLSAISRYVHDALHDLALTGGGAKRVLKSIPIIREILIELGYLDSSTPVPGLGPGQGGPATAQAQAQAQGHGGGGLLNQSGGETLDQASVNQALSHFKQELGITEAMTEQDIQERLYIIQSNNTITKMTARKGLYVLGYISNIGGSEPLRLRKRREPDEEELPEPQRPQRLLGPRKPRRQRLGRVGERLDEAVAVGVPVQPQDERLARGPKTFGSYPKFFKRDGRGGAPTSNVKEVEMELLIKAFETSISQCQFEQIELEFEFKKLLFYLLEQNVMSAGANGNSSYDVPSNDTLNELRFQLSELSGNEMIPEVPIPISNIPQNLNAIINVTPVDINGDVTKQKLLFTEKYDNSIELELCSLIAERLFEFQFTKYFLAHWMEYLLELDKIGFSEISSFDLICDLGTQEMFSDYFLNMMVDEYETQEGDSPEIVKRHAILYSCAKDVNKRLISIIDTFKEKYIVPDSSLQTEGTDVTGVSEGTDDTAGTQKTEDFKRTDKIPGTFEKSLVDSTYVGNLNDLRLSAAPAAGGGSKSVNLQGGFFQLPTELLEDASLNFFLGEYDTLKTKLEGFVKGKISLRTTAAMDQADLGTIGVIIRDFGKTNEFEANFDDDNVKITINQFLNFVQNDLIERCEKPKTDVSGLPYFGKREPVKDLVTLKANVALLTDSGTFNFDPNDEGNPQGTITGSDDTDFKKLRTNLYNIAIQTLAFIQKQIVELEKQKKRAQMAQIRMATAKAKADKHAQAEASGDALPTGFEIPPNYFESLLVMANLAAAFGVELEGNNQNNGTDGDEKIFKVFEWAERRFGELHPKLGSNTTTFPVQERIALQLICEIFTCGLFIRSIDSVPQPTSASATATTTTPGGGNKNMSGGAIGSFAQLNQLCRNKLRAMGAVGNLDDKLEDFTKKIFPKNMFGVSQTDLNDMGIGSVGEKHVVINNASNYSKLKFGTTPLIVYYKANCPGSSIWDPMSYCSGPSLIRDGLNYVVIGNVEHTYQDKDDDLNSMNSTLRPKDPFTNLNAEVEGTYSTAGLGGAPHMFLYFPPKLVGMLSKELEAAKVYSDTMMAFLHAVRAVINPGQGGGSAVQVGGDAQDNLRRVLLEILHSVGEASGNISALFELIEKAVSRKMNGDFFQEVNSVYARGGYSGDITYFKNDPPSLVKFGDDYIGDNGDNGQKLRMGFAGDRPSGIRMYIDLILAATKQMYKPDGTQRNTIDDIKEVINLYSFSGYIRPAKGVTDCIVGYGHQIFNKMSNPPHAVPPPTPTFSSGIADGAGGGKRRKRPRKKANKKKTQRKKSKVKRSRLYKKTLRKKLNKSNKKTKSKHKKRSTSKC